MMKMISVLFVFFCAVSNTTLFAVESANDWLNSSDKTFAVNNLENVTYNLSNFNLENITI
ncbi:MAG: hypothetical protein HY606_09285 [Planctomycetes bacterium]|nr:hypothetical protein [Planctomycetota bacterium]